MTFSDLVDSILEIFNDVIPAIITLALVVFLWKVLKYTLQSTNPRQRQEASTYILYAFIGLFVMTSLWAIVNLILGIFTLPTL